MKTLNKPFYLKRMQSALSALCIASIICWAAPETRAAEIVINGGFETGTTTTAPPWVVVDPSNFTGFASDPAFAHSGNRYCFLGSSNTIGTLTQVLNTTAATPYTLSFWLANDGGSPPNSFEVRVNGVSVLILTNQGGFGYTQFMVAFVGTGSPMTLEFRNRNDPDFWRLDDVSVTGEPLPPPPTPTATPHGSPHATPTPRPHATPTPHPPHVTPTPHPPHATPTPGNRPAL